MSFAELGVCSEILELLKDKGITKPTDVQSGCIPKIFLGLDVVACAKTGSGKTATFLIPIIQSLMTELRPLYALIITPTRELAHQIGEQAAGLNLIRGTSLCNVLVITGGKSIIHQGIDLARGPHIVVATPGRLADLLRTQQAASESGETSNEWSFDRTRVVVLDEADRLLEDNFGKDLSLIMGALPSKRQTLLFSATFSDAVKAAVDASRATAVEQNKRPPLLWQPIEIASGSTTTAAVTVDTLSQYYLLMRPEHKEAFLVHTVDQFLTTNPCSLIMIFTNKCKWCHLIGTMMNSLGIRNVLLHSVMPQRERISSLTQFRSSQVRVLIATDLASRGLDFPTVDIVINHNVPIRPKDYVHRVGRTARAGKAGLALTLCDLFEIKRLKAIQEFIGKDLSAFEVNERKVAKIITEVSIARRDAERKLDEIRFDEKREINKAKKVIPSILLFLTTFTDHEGRKFGMISL
ncbi:ATP-dependent RNA helicase Dbp8 [Fasciola gigantica]|uniref:RNA helicase n=1 Tax=Fasciola gigantica TaxID=46835 RepID=A0A504YWF9_FASGI|nr:ATP-dependent RNA helicase Dbp8 [Fasciola gigantica]